jgi:hypothetical protein
VPIPSQNDRLYGVIADMTPRSLHCTGITVEYHLNGRLTYTIAQHHVGHGDRDLQDGIAEQHNLYTQSMVFDFLGNLAFQILFQHLPLLTGGVEGIVNFFYLLAIVCGKPV